MDEECETGYIQRPFSCLMQNNDDEEFESMNSLSNFIKAHSSSKQNVIPSQPSKLLDDLDACDDLSGYINKSLSSANTVHTKNSVHSKTDEFDECNTLEEYTKSFLNSKGSFLVPNRFRTQSENSNCNVKVSKLDLVDVNERLSQINITSPNEMDISSDHWNIDLTVALQSSKTRTTESVKSCKINESDCKPQIYLAHVHLCDLDISVLASEKLPYSNSILSSFGYVLNREWPKLHLPKKLKKIGKNWPYNKRKSFKFDSPSPDDIVLEKKTRMRINSTNDAYL